ncbi:MAG: PHP domain-containing protein, partial [Lachnospiraceae bacterium]|nr:PHP domain-containing protein [Lachnospiraceae bacterium]
MIYRVYVDGKEKEAEVHFKKCSREADNRAREEIIRHYLDEEAAAEVRIGSAEKIVLHCHTKMSGSADFLSPKELVRQAYENGYKAVAITDCGNVQAFPECYMEWKRLWEEYKEKCSANGKEAVLQDFLKLIYGLEGKLLTEEGGIFPILIYAKNETGLLNLYRIVTASYLQYFENDTALIPVALLDKYREGLMLASADDGVPDTLLPVCEEDSICREILSGCGKECSCSVG